MSHIRTEPSGQRFNSRSALATSRKSHGLQVLRNKHRCFREKTQDQAHRKQVFSVSWRLAHSFPAFRSPSARRPGRKSECPVNDLEASEQVMMRNFRTPEIDPRADSGAQVDGQISPLPFNIAQEFRRVMLPASDAVLDIQFGKVTSNGVSGLPISLNRSERVRVSDAGLLGISESGDETFQPQHGTEPGIEVAGLVRVIEIGWLLPLASEANPSVEFFRV